MTIRCGNCEPENIYILFFLYDLKRFCMESSVSVMTAAPVVPFLMTAVKAFSAVMTAIVPLTVVMAAFMTFPVVMTVMVALRIGIILERALRKRSGCCVR